jgi:23S rRNA-/tRNA-specific pseudouridylate synthase
LENELNYRDKPKNDKSDTEFKGAIKTVHRLDRQTSGVVFFAKTEKASDTFRKLMIDNKISKVYFARVRGDFSKVEGIKDGQI